MNKLRFRRLGLQSDGTIILNPFQTITLNNDNDEFVKVLVIDVETNGLDCQKNHIIELGYVKLEISKKTGLVQKVLSKYSCLQEITEPLSVNIIKITGITDEDLKGQSIDWNLLNEDVKDVDFCVAHNSNFDRPFVESKIKNLRDKKWLCSYNDISWDDWDFPKKSQEALCEYHGFYFVGHRAVNDVEALSELLQKTNPNEDKTYFLSLIEKMNSIEHLVVARNTPFESRIVLKECNFLWEPNHKFWYKYIGNKNELDEIKAILKTDLPTSKSTYIDTINITAENKYKDLSILSKINKTDDTSKVLDVRNKLQIEKEFLILAEKAEYRTKDLLKDRGYIWDKELGSWFMYVSEPESEIEKDWLRENIYNNNLFKGRIIKNQKFIKK